MLFTVTEVRERDGSTQYVCEAGNLVAVVDHDQLDEWQRMVEVGMSLADKTADFDPPGEGEHTVGDAIGLRRDKPKGQDHDR